MGISDWSRYLYQRRSNDGDATEHGGVSDDAIDVVYIADSPARAMAAMSTARHGGGSGGEAIVRGLQMQIDNCLLR